MLERERWEIDETKSKLTFALRHFVAGEIQGPVRTLGGRAAARPGATRSISLQVWIEIDSLDTGDAERDAHLRSPELLDVGRFPRAEFRSTGIALRNDGGAAVSGRLDLHGATRDLELRSCRDGLGRPARACCRAATTCAGSSIAKTFGLHWNQDLDVGGFVVGDNVELTVRLSRPYRRNRTDARP